MTQYYAGQWMPVTPPHGRPPIGKPKPPPKRKTRATKRKHTRRRKQR